MAVRIFIDGFELSKEGEEIDFSKYKMPLEKHWRLSRLETFRAWILYSVKEDNLTTKEELVKSLERTFKPKYASMLSEFRFSLGKDFDFKKEFSNIVKPLLKKGLIVKKDRNFILIEDGRKQVDKIFKSARYHQNR